MAPMIHRKQWNRLTASLWLSFVLTLAPVGTESRAIAGERPPVGIDDLYRQESFTDPILLSGRSEAIMIREWTEAGFKYPRSALWHIAAGADAAAAPTRRPFEADAPDARRPVLSPDGKWIAFQSTRTLADGTPLFVPNPVWSDPATDIWLIPASGGTAIPLGGVKKPYGRVFSDPFYARVSFSPDGKRLAFVADDGADQRTKREQDLAITVVREDQGEGYEGFGAASVWVADLAENPTLIATERFECVASGHWFGDPQWTPDGKTLVVHANRTKDRESVRFSINRNYDILKIDLATKLITPLTSGPGPQVSPRISPDGRRVVCLSVPRSGPHTDVYNLELIDLEDPARSRVLFDHHSASASVPHGSPGFPLPLDTWLDNRWIVVDVPVGTGWDRQVIDTDDPQVKADPHGSKEHPVFAKRTTARDSILPASHAWLRERSVAETKTIRWKSDDIEVEGILTIPPPHIARPPYKLLVFPHGGPHSRSITGFQFPTQIFAGQGYLVFQPNFRGSSGYGRRFLDADRRDLGGGDMRDILSGIEQLIRDGLADRNRQFVHGVSYGGYMTAWLIGHTHQFRAAAPQNAVTDLNVMWGVSDLQSWTEWELGGKPWEVADEMRLRSPFTHVQNVKTPTLILHADRDRRCPLPMGLMFYRGLKSAGVETQMVIYHDERHGIVRLDHQADIYRRILDWFAAHDMK